MDPAKDFVKAAAEGTARGSLFAFFDGIGAWFRRRRRKRRLLSMLKDERWEFGRTLGRLADGIGADHATTKDLLVDIGARPSENNKDLWTLKPPPSKG